MLVSQGPNNSGASNNTRASSTGLQTTRNWKQVRDRQSTGSQEELIDTVYRVVTMLLRTMDLKISLTTNPIGS